MIDSFARALLIGCFFYSQASHAFDTPPARVSRVVVEFSRGAKLILENDEGRLTRAELRVDGSTAKVPSDILKIINNPSMTKFDLSGGISAGLDLRYHFDAIVVLQYGGEWPVTCDEGNGDECDVVELYFSDSKFAGYCFKHSLVSECFSEHWSDKLILQK